MDPSDGGESAPPPSDVRDGGADGGTRRGTDRQSLHFPGDRARNGGCAGTEGATGVGTAGGTGICPVTAEPGLKVPTTVKAPGTVASTNNTWSVVPTPTIAVPTTPIPWIMSA